MKNYNTYSISGINKKSAKRFRTKRRK